MINKHTKSISLAFLIITSTLASLVITAPTASAGVSGNITSDTTWSGTVYVEGDVTVDPGVTLTIDPGTRVKFNNPGASLYVEGSLLANGDPWDWIYFESNQTIPTNSDWESIEGNVTGHLEMTYCDVRHFSSKIYYPDTIGNILNNCAFNETNGLVFVNAQYVNITDCSFTNDFRLSGSNHLVKNCIFTEVSKFYLDASYCHIENINNTGNGIYFDNFGKNNSIFNAFVASGSVIFTHDNTRLDNFTYANSGFGIFDCDGGFGPFPDNFLITNSSIPLDIMTFSVRNAHVKLYNTSFNKSKIRYDDSIAEVIVGYYMDVNVTDSSGAPVSNANVWVNNTQNSTVDQQIGITDINGWLYDVLCTEYRGNDTNGNNNDLDPGERIYYTPHNATANKDGSKGYNETLMDASKVVNIILEDNTPPSASSYSPTGVGIPINSQIVIQWNDTMNWTSVEKSFNYTDGMTVWNSTNGIWVHNPIAETSNFTPTALFDYLTQYWVDVNITATDASGNPLDQDKDGISGEWPQDVLNWTFTTIANAEPTTTISTPDTNSDWTGAIPQAIWWNCTDIEDTAADGLTIFLNYTSSDGSGVIAGPLLNETDKPHTWALPAIDAVDVIVQATVIDSNGARGYFDTPAFTIDSTSPQLTGTSPINNSAGNTPASVITLTFDEAMNQVETEAAFTLVNGTSVVAGTFSWNAQVTEMTFTPSQDLDLDTTYLANITNAAEDDSDPGNSLESFNSTNFKTIKELDTIGPAVTIGPTIMPVTTVYDDGFTSYTIWFNATFDDTNLGNSTIADAEWTVRFLNATPPSFPNGTGSPFQIVDGSYDEVNESVSIPIAGPQGLGYGLIYLWAHGLDSEGNWGDWECAFLEVIDKRPPTVLSAQPSGTNVSTNSTTTVIWIYFDEAMNHTAVEESFSISPSLPGTFSWFDNWVSFKSNVNFSDNTTYTVTLNSSIAKDIANNTLDGNENIIPERSPTDDYSWSFITWLDTDDDGSPDSVDIDDDNDGIPDTIDEFPKDPTESVDTDGDGTGNNADTDDDGDGVLDVDDLDPLDPAIGADTTPPSAPTHLNLTAQDNGILVKWEASSDSDLHHYSVYRSTDNITFTWIGNVTGLTSYFDGNVVNDTTYYYKVTAVDNVINESPFSEVVHLRWGDVGDQPPLGPENYLPYLIIPIIVVVLLLAVAMLFRRKQKKPADKRETKEEVAPEETDEMGT